jgi:hypothetical protein
VVLELLVIVIAIAIDGRVLDGAAHPLDLTVRPGMLHFGQAVLNAVLLVAQIEHVRHVSGGRAVGVSRREGELDPFVGQDGVDPVRDGFDHTLEEGRGRSLASRRRQLHDREFTRAIDRYIEVELAFRGLDLSGADVGRNRSDRP